VRHLAAALGKRVMSTARPDTEPPPSEPPMSPMTEPAATREHHPIAPSYRVASQAEGFEKMTLSVAA